MKDTLCYNKKERQKRGNCENVLNMYKVLVYFQTEFLFFREVPTL